MYSVALGAAAGGGFPQWNSNAPACNRARAGDARATPRTQAALAVSADGQSWLLLNASPDLREQIAQSSFLRPREGLRSSPIRAVVLTGAEVDNLAGLLVMRERHPFAIYATKAVHAVLNANPIFEVLDRTVVERVPVGLDTPVRFDSQLSFTVFAVPGKIPLYLERPDAAPCITEDETTVGVSVTDGRRTLYYIPGCASVPPALARRLRGADLVYFDGTLWSDEELIRAGVGHKTGRRMGHMSVAGPDGSLAALRDLGVHRKVLIHINNSNPVLLDDSAERAIVTAAGWEVAYDGMEIVL